MNAHNLAIVLAPTLLNGPDPKEDLTLLLEPDKVKALAPELEGKQTLLGLLEMWIVAWEDTKCTLESGPRAVRHGLLDQQGVGRQAPPVSSI